MIVKTMAHVSKTLHSLLLMPMAIISCRVIVLRGSGDCIVKRISRGVAIVLARPSQPVKKMTLLAIRDTSALIVNQVMDTTAMRNV